MQFNKINHQTFNLVHLRMQFGSKTQSIKWKILWLTAMQETCCPKSHYSQWESGQQNLESPMDFRVGTYIRSTVQKLLLAAKLRYINLDISPMLCILRKGYKDIMVGPNAQEHNQKSLKWTLKNSEHKTEIEWVQDQMNSFQPKNWRCSKLK